MINLINISSEDIKKLDKLYKELKKRYNPNEPNFYEEMKSLYKDVFKKENPIEAIRLANLLYKSGFANPMPLAMGDWTYGSLQFANNEFGFKGFKKEKTKQKREERRKTQSDTIYLIEVLYKIIGLIALTVGVVWTSIQIYKSIQDEKPQLKEGQKKEK